MKNQLAKVKNVVNFASTLHELVHRDAGMPGMGLVYGFTGSGKTTTIAWSLNQLNGLYVRATSVWTPFAMYRALLKELGISPLHSAAKMMDAAVEQLLSNPRPLFVDETDYLLKDSRMLEGLRDLHDLANVPVILIGMEGIETKLVHRKQLARRISQWLEFAPCDVQDTALLAETCCAVQLGDDLLQLLHKQSGGSIGQMVVGLGRLESYARAQRLQKLTLSQWQDSNRKLFLGRAA